MFIVLTWALVGAIDWIFPFFLFTCLDVWYMLYRFAGAFVLFLAFFYGFRNLGSLNLICVSVVEAF
jgi:hypothetical protein